MNTISIKKTSCRQSLAKIVGIAMLGTILLAGGAGAATLKVDASGGADYTMIQDAINKASSGDTILVYSGTYYESINVNKKLILRGIDNGGGKPVINAIGSGSEDTAITLSAGESTLEGFKATEANNGIKINSNNNIVKNNIVSNNNEGIVLKSSSNNELSGNIADSNNGNGISLDSSSGNKLIGNTANSNVGNGIDIILSSNGNSLSGNKVSNNGRGIRLASSNNNNLNGNEVSKNTEGISLSSSSGNKLIDNIVNSNEGNGLQLLDKSDSNTLSGNTVNSNKGGIYFFGGSSNNEFSGNIAKSNKGGVIYMNAGSNNLLKDNTFESNWDGINLDAFSKNNRIFHNNFIKNGKQAYDYSGSNFWDSGNPTTGGNYWSDYNGLDANNNGIGDTPYRINGGGADRYPFVRMNGWPKSSTTPTATPSIKVTSPTEAAQTGMAPTEKASGFEVIIAVIGIIGALRLRRKL